MSVIRYEELDQLTGELLPERTVLGVVSTPLNIGGRASYFAGSSNQGNAAFSAIQSGQGQAAGLFGAVSLSSQSLLGNLGLAGTISVI